MECYLLKNFKIVLIDQSHESGGIIRIHFHTSSPGSFVEYRSHLDNTKISPRKPLEEKGIGTMQDPDL